MPTKEPQKNGDDFGREMASLMPGAAFVMGVSVGFMGEPLYMSLPLMALGGSGMVLRLLADEKQRRAREINGPENNHVNIGGKKFSYDPSIKGLRQAAALDPDDAIVFKPSEETYDLELWRGPDGKIPEGMLEIEMMCKAMRNTPVTQWPAFERAVGRILDRKGVDSTFSFGDVQDEVGAELKRLEQIGREEELRKSALEHEKTMSEVLQESSRQYTKSQARKLRDMVDRKKKIRKQTAHERAVRLAEKVIESYGTPPPYFGDMPSLEDDELEYDMVDFMDGTPMKKIRRAAPSKEGIYLVGEGGDEVVVRPMSYAETVKNKELFEAAQRFARKYLDKKGLMHTRKNMLAQVHELIHEGLYAESYDGPTASALIEMNAETYGPYNGGPVKRESGY